MPIIEPAIRPPSEADSFLLQVTLGCSANSCTFCGAYQAKTFKIKPLEIILKDIALGAKLYPETRKVFLMDGDALVLSTARLLPILKELNSCFPKLTRISTYANDYNIMNKSDDDLRDFYRLKLRLLYMGLETGSQEILSLCQKKSTVKGMLTSVKRAASLNIKTSIIVLLGIGGKKYSSDHVVKTAAVLNQMQPRYLSFLSLMLIPKTLLYISQQKGEFTELDSLEMLKEMYRIIEKLDLKKTIFRSNHASNYLSLEGRFPGDKEKILKEIIFALEGKTALRPELFRGL